MPFPFSVKLFERSLIISKNHALGNQLLRNQQKYENQENMIEGVFRRFSEGQVRKEKKKEKKKDHMGVVEGKERTSEKKEKR